MRQLEGKQNPIWGVSVVLQFIKSFQVATVEIDEVAAHAVVPAAFGEEQSVHEHPEGRDHHSGHRDCKFLLIFR